MVTGNYPYGIQPTPFSSTPTFDLSTGNMFSMTLTGPITISVVNGQPGHLYTFVFTQDGLGLHPVTWPGNFKGVISIPITVLANTASVQMVMYDGNNFYAIAIGQINL